jgi:hypothetical protein
MTVRTNVNLEVLMSQFEDFSHTIGPAEYQILENAEQFLNITIPIDEAGKLAYRSKSASIQGKLNNLLSRVSQVHNMHAIDKEAYWGQVFKDYDSKGKDRFSEALACDPRLRDMQETYMTFSVLKDHINNVLWSVKTVLGRL